jgi:hypothetical protein
VHTAMRHEGVQCGVLAAPCAIFSGDLTCSADVAHGGRMGAIQRFEFDGDVLGVIPDAPEGILVGFQSLCGAIGTNCEYWSGVARPIPAYRFKAIAHRGGIRMAIPSEVVEALVLLMASGQYSTATKERKTKYNRYIEGCTAALHKQFGKLPVGDPLLREIWAGVERVERVVERLPGDVEASFAKRGHAMYKRIDPYPDCKDTLTRVVQHAYGGKCPCGGCGVVIVRDGKILKGRDGKPVAHFDHIQVRTNNRAEVLWLLRAECHAERGDRWTERWRKAFDTFQDHRLRLFPGLLFED